MGWRWTRDYLLEDGRTSPESTVQNFEDQQEVPQQSNLSGTKYMFRVAIPHKIPTHSFFCEIRVAGGCRQCLPASIATATREKIYMYAGPEFGELQGRCLIILKAL